jgi:hypothetical protein
MVCCRVHNVSFRAYRLARRGGGQKGGGTVNWEEVLYFPQRAVEWLAANPVSATLIAIGVFLLLVLAIFITWWSSRGKFMFLDNVVHDRSQVVALWKEYKVEGNSLFVLNLALGIIVFMVVAAYVVRCFASLLALYESSEALRTLIEPAILMVLGLIAILLLVGLINLLVRDFLVPIMYKEHITVLKAIRKFFPLFLSHLLYFLGYAIFKFVIVIVVAIGIVRRSLILKAQADIRASKTIPASSAGTNKYSNKCENYQTPPRSGWVHLDA